MSIKRPLRKAQENICAYKMEEQIETRLSDGFSALKVQEVQSAVIAGMGGNLVIRILEEGHDVVSCSYSFNMESFFLKSVIRC